LTGQKEHTAVNTLQAWLVVGLPLLIAAFALFYGRSRIRTLLGYVALLVAFGVMVTVDRASAVVIGGLAALAVGAGRGGQAESEIADTSRIAVPDSTRRTSRLRRVGK
jgi:hypothetical protein